MLVDMRKMYHCHCEVSKDKVIMYYKAVGRIQSLLALFNVGSRLQWPRE